MSIFSQRFKYLRTSSGFTQDEIAKKLKVGRSTIGSYEQGVRKPDIDQLIEIAKMFNVDVGYLIGYEKGKEFKDNTMDEWIEAGESMSGKEREKWLKALKVLGN